MIVELHMLQNFAPSCLNRDDTNSPKECEFGGYRRARISSQCIKRSIREYFKNNLLISPSNMASRTRLLVSELSKRLIEKGKPEEEATKVSTEAIKAMGLKLKDSNKTEYLVFIGEQEINGLLDVMLAHWNDLLSSNDEKKLKSVGKEFLEKLNGGKAVDLALFGRMLADLPDNNRDAACQVAHAISTHKVGREFDYYTAVDDLQKEGETGAGMVGDIEFNSACYYRYANINVEELKKNLAGDATLTCKAVEAFIKASIAAIPSGKQTSFSAQNPPDFVMAVVRNSGTWSLANAFSTPIKEGGDLVALSIEALVGYWNKLNKYYPDNGIIVKPAISLKDIELPGIAKAGSFDELVHTVNQVINSNC